MSLPYYPIIVGPVAPYNNVAVNPEYYKPSQFFITAIGLGQTTTITTAVNQNYVIGQLCRLLIPRVNGTRQLNEQLGYVISIPNPNQVVLGIDSSFFDTFVVTTQPTQPQIVAVGDVNTGHINDDGNLCTKPWIPGSFRDISPRSH
jgi:hypothetical protein